MGDNSGATVRIRRSNRRARENPELMFHWLQRFANLEDDFLEFETFAQEYPNFLPVRFYDVTQGEEGRNQPVSWRREFYGLFRVFRDMLRDVWERGSNSELAVLLGTDVEAWNIISREAEPGVLDRIFGGYETSLKKAMTGIPQNYFAVPSRVYPDWRASTFRYEADTDFRRAVYELFRQSWRARVCPQCRKYFVADKPPRRYCSSKCYGAAKLDRDREFWRNKGSSRRKERKSKETKR